MRGFIEYRFQFHNGSIKRLLNCYSRVLNKSFNSTMVRLKVVSDEFMALPENKFQFHNGSIKS